MNQHLNESEVRVGLEWGMGMMRALLNPLDTAWQPNYGKRNNDKLGLLVGPAVVTYTEDLESGEIAVDIVPVA